MSLCVMVNASTLMVLSSEKQMGFKFLKMAITKKVSFALRTVLTLISGFANHPVAAAKVLT